MTIFHALLLSLVEGITEFLPVSSTGHLILAGHILGVNPSDFSKSFEIIIQLGAILAVSVLFFQRCRKNPTMLPKLIVAFIPSAIVGLTFYKVIKNFLLGNSLITVIALILGGIAIIIFENFWHKKRATTNFHTMSYAQAFIIGLFQSVSIIPGVSRAATTILGGMFQGLSRADAVEFSFLLAVPTIAAASIFDLLKNGMHWNLQEIGVLGIGFLGAFVSALIIMHWFLKFVKANTLIPFAVYRIVAGILFWFFIIR